MLLTETTDAKTNWFGTDDYFYDTRWCCDIQNYSNL